MKRPLTVYVAMSADLLHPGHINILKIASEKGRVVVGLLTDEAIASYKKPPTMKWDDRRIVIENLSYVDEVMKQKPLITPITKKLPQIVVHGDDWKTGVQKNVRNKVIEVLKEWNGELLEVPYTEGISSTEIKNKLKEMELLLIKEEHH